MLICLTRLLIFTLTQRILTDFFLIRKQLYKKPWINMTTTSIGNFILQTTWMVLCTRRSSMEFQRLIFLAISFRTDPLMRLMPNRFTPKMTSLFYGMGLYPLLQRVNMPDLKLNFMMERMMVHWFLTRMGLPGLEMSALNSQLPQGSRRQQMTILPTGKLQIQG